MNKGVLACVLGVVLMVTGLASAKYNLTLLLTGEETFGQVIGYDVLGAGKSARYGAKASFEIDGHTYTTTPENYTKKRRYRTRDWVSILYLEGNPQQAKLTDDVSLGAVTWLPLGIGTLTLLFGWGLLTGRVEKID